jgi:hypothetical protein
MSSTPPRKAEGFRPRLLLFLLAGVACNSPAQHGTSAATPASTADPAQQSMLTCVDSALASSAIVDRANARRVNNPATRYVVLRNSPSRRVPGVLFSLTPAHGAPREFVVEYVWPGPSLGSGGMAPPPNSNASDFEGQMLTDVAVQLLQLVRSRCAPDAAGEPACSRVADGRGGRCVLGT